MNPYTDDSDEEEFIPPEMVDQGDEIRPEMIEHE
jgi:hypothetical protein